MAQTVGGNSTVNVESLGSFRLPRRTTGDLRVFKTQQFGSRSLEVSVDFNKTINLRQNGDPAGALNTLPQFGSPSQVYGPRNIRFNVAFRF